MTGAYVALMLAAGTLCKGTRSAETRCARPSRPSRSASRLLPRDAPRAILLDLDYAEDSTAEVDLNVVGTSSGRFVEIQGTAEKEPFDEAMLGELLAAARRGLSELFRVQRAALEGRVPDAWLPDLPQARAKNPRKTSASRGSVLQKGVVPPAGELEERRVRPRLQDRLRILRRHERVPLARRDEEGHPRSLEPLGEGRRGEDAVDGLLGREGDVLLRRSGLRLDGARDEGLLAGRVALEPVARRRSSARTRARSRGPRGATWPST